MARFTKYFFIFVLLAMSASISLSAAHKAPHSFTVDSFEFDYHGLLQLRFKDKVQINSGEYSGCYTVEEDFYETREGVPGPLSDSQEPLLYIQGRKIVLLKTGFLFKTTISFYFENSLKDQPVILEDEDGNPVDRAFYEQNSYIIQRYFNAQTIPIIMHNEKNYNKKRRGSALVQNRSHQICVSNSGTESDDCSSDSDSDQEQPKKVKKPQLHVTTKPSTVDTQEQSVSQSPISPSFPATISQSSSTQSLRTPYIMDSSENDDDDDDESTPASKPLNNSYFKNMFSNESSPLFTKIVVGCATIVTLFALWQLNQ